jgi:hypothetical protein
MQVAESGQDVTDCPTVPAVHVNEHIVVLDEIVTSPLEAVVVIVVQAGRTPEAEVVQSVSVPGTGVKDAQGSAAAEADATRARAMRRRNMVK